MLCLGYKSPFQFQEALDKIDKDCLPLQAGLMKTPTCRIQASVLQKVVLYILLPVSRYFRTAGIRAGFSL